MNTGTVSQGAQGIRTTHLRVGWILALVIIIPLALLAGAVAWIKLYQAKIQHQEAEAANWVPTQRAQYMPEKAPPPEAKPLVEDPNAERWAQLMQQLAAMQNELNMLKNRREPGPAPVTKEKPEEKPKKHASMLFMQREDKATAVAADTFLLAPGGKLACQVETAMNSDTGETFFAKVITNVYDTSTGTHLLIPQNSTIIGQYDAEGLLFGNERLPTLGLSVTLPNGRNVELGKAPVTDRIGAAGLVSRINEHWGRLIGAVFIGGALRGGAMALQSQFVGGNPATQIPLGITQSGGQVIQRQQGRAIDTRPTIHVDAGEICQVLVTKALRLPEVHL